MKPRILIYDIETSLQIVAVFQLAKNDYIQPQNILQERHIISVCWKWLDAPKVYSSCILDDPTRYMNNPTDDTHVCNTFHDVLMEADCVVGHNGDGFDMKYLKTRFLKNGLQPLPPITSIDTYKIAKQQFMFNANRLDYIGNYLGLGGKKHTPTGLWLDVLRGDKRAIRTMVEYNKRDVTLLEGVFLKLRPYIPNHINRELFGNTGCPKCGSHKVQSRGFHRPISRIYRRFQCQKCSSWFRSVVNEKDIKPLYRTL